MSLSRYEGPSIIPEPRYLTPEQIYARVCVQFIDATRRALEGTDPLAKEAADAAADRHAERIVADQSLFPSHFERAFGELGDTPAALNMKARLGRARAVRDQMKPQ